jgi:hypothetical protein
VINWYEAMFGRRPNSPGGPSKVAVIISFAQTVSLWRLSLAQNGRAKRQMQRGKCPKAAIAAPSGLSRAHRVALESRSRV